MTSALICVQAVMIGDSLAADVQGAQNAGLAASVWVNRGGQARPPQACTLPWWHRAWAFSAIGLGLGLGASIAGDSGRAGMPASGMHPTLVAPRLRVSGSGVVFILATGIITG